MMKIFSKIRSMRSMFRDEPPFPNRPQATLFLDEKIISIVNTLYKLYIYLRYLSRLGDEL